MFDGGGTRITSGSIGNGFIKIYVSYPDIEDIEMKGFFWNQTDSTPAMINIGIADHEIVKDVYIHGWSHGTVAAGTHEAAGMYGFCSTGGNAGAKISYNVINGSDTADVVTHNTSLLGIVCIGNRDVPTAEVDHNVIFYASDGIDHADYIHDNNVGFVFLDFDNCAVDPTGCNHEDGIYANGGAQVLNNLVHDVCNGEAMYPGIGSGLTTYLINNVIWLGTSCSYPHSMVDFESDGFPSSTAIIYGLGNTIAPDAGQSCATIIGRAGVQAATLYWQNNTCIGTGSTFCTSAQSSQCGQVTSPQILNNTLMSPSDAVTAGMTNAQSFVYSQTTANCNGAANCPVNQGANWFSLCSTIAALCSDTTYAVTLSGTTAVNSGRVTNTRWSSSTVPCGGSPCGDIGAYTLSGSGQVVTPAITPPSGPFGSPPTVTITDATTGATICFTVDGSTPTANGAGTCTHGTTYSTSFTGPSIPGTVKAIGSKSGSTDSPIPTVSYTTPSSGAGSTIAPGGVIVPGTSVTQIPNRPTGLKATVFYAYPPSI